MSMNEIWVYNHPEPILTVEIGDLNGNGEGEVIAATKDGKILIFSLDGNLIFQKMVSDQPTWHVGLVDFDDDQNNGIITGGMDGILRVFKLGKSNELDLAWKHHFNSSISGFLIEKIVGENEKRIISYSLDKTIRVLNPLDGTMEWGQVFEDGIGDAISWHDLENPSQNQVIACGNDGTVRGFDGQNGELLWFKRYPDKLRCVSSFSAGDGEVIATGGDEKALHFINAANHEEFKSMRFDDYVWKLKSLPIDTNDKLIASTYSFDYLDDSTSIENLIFTSKLACIDNDLKIAWEIEDINVECIESLAFKNHPSILIGTTRGEILMIDAILGNRYSILHRGSCVNMLKKMQDENLILSCHDDGSLHFYSLK